MKIIYTSILMLSGTLCYSKNDLTNLRINGDVSKITYNKYDAYDKMGKLDIKAKGKEVYKFNNGGNITEISYYNQSNKIVKIISNTYNTIGQLTKTDTVMPDYYDTKKAILYYDSIGNISSRAIYGAKGEVYKKINYHYEVTGNLKREDIFNSDGAKIGEVSYQYEKHSNGKVSAIYMHFESMEMLVNSSDTKWNFDTSGNYIGGMGFKNEEQPDEYKYAYNNNGDITRNEKGETFIYKYDPKNNVSEIIKYEIKFDKPYPVEYTKCNMEYKK